MSKAKETQSKFVMDLQLFSDSEPSQADLSAQALAMLQGGGQEPQAAAHEGQPMQGESNPQISPQNTENGGQPVPGQQANQVPTDGQPGQQAQNSDAMILGKFKSPDEMANAYVNLERFNTQTRQELAQTQQTIQELQATLQQMQAQNSNNVVNPQSEEPEMTQDEMNEMMMNKFYENPSEFFNELKEQAKNSALQELAPIRQQYQEQQNQQMYNQAMSELSQQAPDIQQFEPQMMEILNQNPELSGHPGGMRAALNIAYQMAKGQSYQDPSALLQDQNFVKQNILGNQDIKNQVIQEYLQSLKQGNQAPTVINGQANGSMPVMPENRPQTIKDARNIALEYLKG